MKIKFLLILTIAAFLPTSGCSAPETKIEYSEPDSWSQSNFGPAIFYLNPKDSDESIQFVAERSISQDYQMNDLTDLIENEKQNCITFEILSEQVTSINELQAFEFVESCHDKELNVLYKIKSIRIMKNNQLAEFNLYSKENRFEENEAIFDTVVHSINWND